MTEKKIKKTPRETGDTFKKARGVSATEPKSAKTLRDLMERRHTVTPLVVALSAISEFPQQTFKTFISAIPQFRIPQRTETKSKPLRIPYFTLSPHNQQTHALPGHMTHCAKPNAVTLWPRWLKEGSDLEPSPKKYLPPLLSALRKLTENNKNWSMFRISHHALELRALAAVPGLLHLREGNLQRTRTATFQFAFDAHAGHELGVVQRTASRAYFQPIAVWQDGQQ